MTNEKNQSQSTEQKKAPKPLLQQAVIHAIAGLEDRETEKKIRGVGGGLAFATRDYQEFQFKDPLQSGSGDGNFVATFKIPNDITHNGQFPVVVSSLSQAFRTEEGEVMAQIFCLPNFRRIEQQYLIKPGQWDGRIKRYTVPLDENGKTQLTLIKGRKRELAGNTESGMPGVTLYEIVFYNLNAVMAAGEVILTQRLVDHTCFISREQFRKQIDGYREEAVYQAEAAQKDFYQGLAELLKSLQDYLDNPPELNVSAPEPRREPPSHQSQPRDDRRDFRRDRPEREPQPDNRERRRDDRDNRRDQGPTDNSRRPPRAPKQFEEKGQRNHRPKNDPDTQNRADWGDEDDSRFNR